EEGGKVDVGQRIAFIGEEGKAAPKEEKKAPEKKEKKEEPPKKEAKKPEEPKKEQAETEKPASAKAEEKETAPPQGKKDVEAGVSPAPKQGQLPLQGGSRIQLSGMRKGIAERLVQSKAPVPHFYLNIDIDAGPLMEARAELKSAGEDSDTSKITVNDFVLKAAVMAAVKVPKVNASFDIDAIVQYADVDLGIAVAIEDGLLTPVIRA